MSMAILMPHLPLLPACKVLAKVHPKVMPFNIRIVLEDGKLY
jgi:hypothetical protein